MRGEMASCDKPWLEVAVLGPPGSGKTTLVHALADRAWHRLGRPTRRPRGRPVPRPPHGDCETAARRYHLMNRPGDADGVCGLLDRLGGIDGAILVASAAGRGALPRQHVWLARQLGVPFLVAFLSHADAAPPDCLEQREADVRTLLHAEGYPGDDAPVIAGDGRSALCSGGKCDAACRPLDDLLAALDSRLRPPRPAAEGPFRMTVDEVSYFRKGSVTAAAGRIEQGRVELGRRIAVVGLGDPAPVARVAGLRQFHRSPGSATAGDRVAVLLRSRRVPGLAPGCVLCRPGTIGAPPRFEALVCQPAAAVRRPRPWLTDGRVRLRFGPREAHGRCRVLDWGAEVGAGRAARVSVELDGAATVGVYEGRRFELRFGAVTAQGVVARTP